jgi:hypothetical protein
VKNLVRIDRQNYSETPGKRTESQVSGMSFNIKTKPMDNI